MTDAWRIRAVAACTALEISAGVLRQRVESGAPLSAVIGQLKAIRTLTLAVERLLNRQEP